jgi:hypothetical protein
MAVRRRLAAAVVAAGLASGLVAARWVHDPPPAPNPNLQPVPAAVCAAWGFAYPCSGPISTPPAGWAPPTSQPPPLCSVLGDIPACTPG